jgi:hypothetical protein
MKRETLFLKVAVVLIALPVLALCINVLPQIASDASEHPASVRYLFLFGMYAEAVPFFFALYQALKLLGYIDGNKAFSALSVTALKKIKYCAVAISILHVTGLPFLYRIAEIEEPPGFILFGMVVPFASIVIAVFAAVLQKLLQKAIDIQSENDLTV